MVRRPAVSMMQMSRPRRSASATPARAADTGRCSLKTVTPCCFTQDAQLLDAPAVEVGSDQSGLRPLLFHPHGQLAEAVVLPSLGGQP